jgi:hypothetical protein
MIVDRHDCGDVNNKSACGPREEASLRATQRERAGVGPREQ